MELYPDIEKVLLSEEQIASRVQELADEINRDYEGCELLVVGLLKGSFIFLSDLVRKLKMDVTVDFMTVSSYGKSTVSSGNIRIMMDVGVDLRGKHVLIVEDILDTGNTLSVIRELLLQRSPESVKICTLMDKPARRKAQINGDYVGFVIPDEFIVGYGPDYAEKFRNLPFVGVLKREVYEK